MEKSPLNIISALIIKMNRNQDFFFQRLTIDQVWIEKKFKNLRQIIPDNIGVTENS